MNNVDTLDANVLIAMLRGLTHESQRVGSALENEEMDEQSNEELNLYGNDLDLAISFLSEAYESRRKAGGAEARLTEIGLLLHYFEEEKLV